MGEALDEVGPLGDEEEGAEALEEAKGAKLDINDTSEPKSKPAEGTATPREPPAFKTEAQTSNGERTLPPAEADDAALKVAKLCSSSCGNEGSSS